MSGEFNKTAYKHNGSLFIPLRSTEYIEYPLLFRFPGYFCILEQKFKMQSANNFMQPTMSGDFTNTFYKHMGSLFIPFRLTEYIEHPLIFLFSGYFCFLE